MKEMLAKIKEEAEKKHSSEAQTITQDSPISKALTSILDYAAKSKASDIHIEPLEKSLVIRCRIDGVLRKTMELPKSIEPALISRIKIMARLKIDEHRIPQDGQLAVIVNDNEIDLRIATSPVVWGEQVVIRLLDKSGTSMEVESMGMTGRALKDVLEGISRPNGMILTSGPTGSGKSTTLYALIKKIKNETINIVTLEDPVEYKMDGVNQIQINTDAGLTFASGLRSILRQDPDVVMVGEIRDSETAGLAVQAAKSHVEEFPEIPISENPSNSEVFHWSKVLTAASNDYEVPMTTYDQTSAAQREYVDYAYYASIFDKIYDDIHVNPTKLAAADMSGDSLAVQKVVLGAMLDSKGVAYAPEASCQQLFELNR